MKRFSLILLYALLAIPIAVFAQDSTTGTVRGNIVDTTEAQLPIEGVLVVMVSAANGFEYETVTDSNGEYGKHGLPPSRYLLCIYKAGYVDRVSKPVTVVAGGDHYVPLKMARKSGLIDLLHREFTSTSWLLPLILIGAFLLGIYVGRRTRHRSDY